MCWEIIAPEALVVDSESTNSGIVLVHSHPQGISTYRQCNKTVFKMTCYVSARLSISSKCLHNPYAALNAIAYMCQTVCDVTSSNVLQYEQKGWDRGGGLVYTPKGRKQHGCVCVWLGAARIRKTCLSNIIKCR